MDLDLADMPLRNLHSGTSIIRRLTLPSSLRRVKGGGGAWSCNRCTRVQGGRGFGDRSSACRMGPGTVLGGNPSRPCRYQSTWQPPLHPPPRFSGRHFKSCTLRPLAMCTMFRLDGHTIDGIGGCEVARMVMDPRHLIRGMASPWSPTDRQAAAWAGPPPSPCGQGSSTPRFNADAPDLRCESPQETGHEPGQRCSCTLSQVDSPSPKSTQTPRV